MKTASMKNSQIIKRVLHYLKRYIPFMVLSLILAATSAILALYMPILIGDGVDLAVDKGSVDFSGLVQVLQVMAIIIIISGVSKWLMNVINNRITYAVVRDIRKEAFEKIETLPLAYLDNEQPGDIVSRIISDADQFADGLLMGFSQLFTGLITILGTLVFMVILNPKITVLVVCITPLSLVVAAFIAKKTHNMFALQSSTRGEQTSYIDEIIGNEKIVHAFNYEDDATEVFEEINDRLAGCALRAVFFSSTTNPATRFVNAVVYAAVALSGAIGACNGVLTVGQLTSFLSYANQYTKPFNEISSVITELQNALTCAGRLLEFIARPSEAHDAEDAVVLESAKGNVDIKNISFSYVKEKPLIEDFSIQVKQGMRVAIVGPTGCGKTTIINLLMRFYDVDSGAICLDGTDIRDITRDSLRAGYGMVLQETWLRSGTIRDNIAMGRPEATLDEIIEAAKKAHAHSFIKRLEQGYDTYIGEDGGMLSQGQKQLICIARVMLCMPPILILDEATSSIDTMTEMRIQKAFKTMTDGRTSFIVAHRLSTIREADIILVMRDGHIVESGNHEELLKKHGFYEELYLSQYSN